MIFGTSVLTALGFGFVTPGEIANSQQETVVESGAIQVEVSYYEGDSFCAENPQVVIRRSGEVALQEALPDSACRIFNMDVQDLDGDQESEILINFYSGGAHCCTFSNIYRYQSDSNDYISITQSWGNPSFQLEDLDGDGLMEFVSADNRFAYRFAGYAASGMPLQIWQYRQGDMVDVTRNYPDLVYSDAYRWWQAYTEVRTYGAESKGVLAAYLADKYLLGQEEDGWERVQAVYQESDRLSFFTDLRQFLTDSGYAVADASERIDPVNPEDYIGLQYVPDPPGRVPLPGDPMDLGGHLILENTSGGAVDFRYGISYMTVGRQLLLSLDEFVGYEADGSPIRVIADMVIPDPQEVSSSDIRDGNLVISSSCLLNGVTDTEIVAIAYPENEEFYTQFVYAWRANQETGQLEDISTEGLACPNFGWGV
jgi:hypothetical protein